MILGAINLQTDFENSEHLIQETLKELSWDSCTSEKIDWNAFSAVRLYDIRSKYSSSEKFCYIDEEKGSLILIDGHIFNHEEICDKLSIPVNSIQLPELILKAYLNWGESFVNYLNGDFIIIIYSVKGKIFLVFRDHLGLRPLAYSQLGPVLYFASDIMGLCKTLYGHEGIDKDYLINLFLNEGHDYSILPNRNVKKLLPGHMLKGSTNGIELKQYWFPELIRTNKRLKFNKIQTDLTDLLIDAVKIRSDLNITASAHVSGGLDSGLIAAFARKEYEDREKFYGFSWTPSPARVKRNLYDTDSVFLDEICRMLNITPVYNNLNIDDYFAFMSEWRHPSEFLYERNTMKAARDRNVDMIFSGWGGDEFISLGNSGIDRDLLMGLNFGLFFKKYPIRQTKILLSALVSAVFPSYTHAFTKLKTEVNNYRYIKNGLGNNIIPRNKRFRYGSRRSIHLQYIKKYHLSKRAEDWYVLGQRSGIEYRYPLLDRRIVEYMLSVPSKALVDDGKTRTIVRKIGQSILPKSIVDNTSKNDQLKNDHLMQIVEESLALLVKETEDFRNNSDLDFIDFQLLNRDIISNKEEEKTKNKKKGLSILFYIKVAHEFTGSYHAQ